MRLGRIAAMVAAAVMVSVTVFAPAAHADTVQQWETRWNTGCLSSGTARVVYVERDCNPMDARQRWHMRYYADGTVRFMNEYTTMCLDDSEYGVRGWGCNDLAYQKWKVNGWGNGWYELLNQYTHHCLDVSEYGVRDVGCNGMTYQQWKVW
ncbi:RICIN domain-containing protein [Dactylosporangium sp. NPDC049140]|uniref:RICIN domain-containing protein n=1 Tax=Dactylosporangium sp. NPDC049140 TaxID=3155647 RepID=UPI003402C8F8